MHHGIFIDLFPMDNIFPNTIMGKIQCFLLYPFKKIKRFKIKKVCLNSRSTYKTWIKLLFYYLLKPFKMESLNILETKIAWMFQNKETVYVTSLTDGGLKEYRRFMLEKEKFYNLVEVEFEGHMFFAPKDYHETLTRNFGDYMLLPPLKDRIPHHGLIKISYDTKIIN